jgi:hypothetical protein
VYLAVVHFFVLLGSFFFFSSGSIFFFRRDFRHTHGSPVGPPDSAANKKFFGLVLKKKFITMTCAQKSKIDVTLPGAYPELLGIVIGLAVVHIFLNIARAVFSDKANSKPLTIMYAIISTAVILVVIGTCSALIHESSQVTVANS